jgi:1-acyl-sn-glycerol-3-phosphate acyltransferase
MLFSFFLIGFIKLLIGAQARWIGCAPASKQRIYFANHSSHLDTLVLWAALPQELRACTRPVAARDYWEKGFLRRRIAVNGFNAVFIERKMTGKNNPLQPLLEALSQGDSLIFFPEGTRHVQELPSQFRSGLYHLASQFPEVELVPVYLDNLHRSMPKGTYFPVPYICTARFGATLKTIANESKQEFLDRARLSIVETA